MTAEGIVAGQNNIVAVFTAIAQSVKEPNLFYAVFILPIITACCLLGACLGLIVGELRLSPMRFAYLLLGGILGFIVARVGFSGNHAVRIFWYGLNLTEMQGGYFTFVLVLLFLGPCLVLAVYIFQMVRRFSRFWKRFSP